MHVQIDFTPEATAAYPALRGLLAAKDNPQLQDAAKFMVPGDFVRIQGIPVPTELQVFIRAWTVMDDETTLQLVLSPVPAAADR